MGEEVPGMGAEAARLRKRRRYRVREEVTVEHGMVTHTLNDLLDRSASWVEEWDGLVRDVKPVCPGCGHRVEYLQPSGLCISCTGRRYIQAGDFSHPIPTNLAGEDGPRCVVCRSRKPLDEGNVCQCCRAHGFGA